MRSNTATYLKAIQSMNLKLADAELILEADARLTPIYRQAYELSFETARGRQLAVNRASSKTAVRLWIEGDADPRAYGLSPTAKFKRYSPSQPRPHLSASRLTGPYRDRAGTSAWYVALTSESDLRKLLTVYLAS